ncbi:PPE family protein [Mycobacterium timonense]|uniref:PPE family protein n=1 Tax=Mycobacterium timonense TaxID=701043 RepID=A0A7I9Z257_9MYCO|nr:PPE family protein [Mycobacterium timonense]GFG94968.1 PPE family protein [Mycobacterium timonense]
MLDFGALPPEFNSARMYSGPGSASMMAAAWAWNLLAAELNSAATDYDRIVTQLVSEEWMGSASAQMAEAAQPYVTWMRTSAARAEQAATSARAAAGAYETAFAATVPPPLIEANRTLLAQAISTNVLGQNIPLITQLEAQYGEMWAQDAATMYGYAAQTAPTAEVTPFTEPAQTTNPAGQAMQAAAVTRAAGTSAGTDAQSQLLSSTPSALQSLASPSSSTASTTPISDALKQNEFVSLWSQYASPTQNTLAMMYRATGMTTHFQSLGKALAPAAKAASDGAKAAAALPTVGASLRGLSGGGGAISASLASAAPVGGLSVPPAWSAATPAVPSGASSIPVSRFITTPDTSGPGNLLGGMPLAGIGGSSGGTGPRYGIRPTVMARPPFAG